MPLMRMEHLTPVKEATAALVGDLEGVEVFGNQVLVAIYQRPEKTASGLYISDGVRAEDQYQGKVGLVLKLGETAFVDDDKVKFLKKAKPGDWVLFKVSDGWPITFNDKKGLCRMVPDYEIRGIVDQPDRVW